MFEIFQPRKGAQVPQAQFVATVQNSPLLLSCFTSLFFPSLHDASATGFTPNYPNIGWSMHRLYDAWDVATGQAVGASGVTAPRFLEMAGYVLRCPTSHESVALKVFEKLDANNSGVLRFADVVAAMDAVYGRSLQARASFAFAVASNAALTAAPTGDRRSSLTLLADTAAVRSGSAVGDAAALTRGNRSSADDAPPVVSHAALVRLLRPGTGNKGADATNSQLAGELKRARARSKRKAAAAANKGPALQRNTYKVPTDRQVSLLEFQLDCRADVSVLQPFDDIFGIRPEDTRASRDRAVARSIKQLSGALLQTGKATALLHDLRRSNADAELAASLSMSSGGGAPRPRSALSSRFASLAHAARGILSEREQARAGAEAEAEADAAVSATREAKRAGKTTIKKALSKGA